MHNKNGARVTTTRDAADANHLPLRLPRRSDVAAGLRRRRRWSRELDRLCGLPCSYSQRARDDFWDAWDEAAA